MPDAGSIGAAIQGLAGGFLTGTDFSRRRRDDRNAAEDRKMRLAQEQESLALAREQARRAGIVQDINLREQHGLTFDMPRMSLDDLRTGVGDGLMTFDDMVVPGARENFLAEPPPEGTFRVGPSASRQATERADALRRSVGSALGMDPTQAEALHEFGVLDDIMGQRVTEAPKDPFSINVDGISTTAATPEEAIAARDRFAVPDGGLSDADIFDRTDALADDFFRESGDARTFSNALSQAAAAGDNAIGDQTLIFSLNNLLDPNAVVRQDDYRRYADAGDLTARAERFWNMIGKDGRLPSGVKDQIRAEINAVGAQKRQQFESSTLERFRQRATQAGVDPTNVIFNPFDTVGGGAPPPPDDIDAVIDEMIANGASDEEIAAELRRRGG